jgi:hypothetical protein
MVKRLGKDEDESTVKRLIHISIKEKDWVLLVVLNQVI